LITRRRGDAEQKKGERVRFSRSPVHAACSPAQAPPRLRASA